MKQNCIFALVLSFALGFGGVAFARSTPSLPVAKKNVYEAHHPNLTGTQHRLEEAWIKVQAAEKAGEFDQDGHAQKAKDLINQAYQELKLAGTPTEKH